MAEEKKTAAAEADQAAQTEEKKPAAEKKENAEEKPAAKKPAAEKKPAVEKKPAAEKPAAEKKEPAKKAAPKAQPKKGADKQVVAPASKVKADEAPKAGSVKITLKRALTGRNKRQIAVAHSLGLRRAGDVCFQPDNAPTKGKIAKISFLLDVRNA